MLGFDLDIWDYLTFVTLFLAVVAGVAFWVSPAGLPGRITIARKHPEAEAVKLLGWAGLLPTTHSWVQAFIWAFGPATSSTAGAFRARRRGRGHRPAGRCPAEGGRGADPNSGSRADQRQVHAPVLRPALWRVVRSYRVGVAETLRRQQVRSDSLAL